MRVRLTKEDLEQFVEDVFPDKPSGHNEQSNLFVWLSSTTIEHLEDWVLQSRPNINRQELSFEILSVQFFCDDFINELITVWTKNINFWNKTDFKKQKKASLYDAFELSLLCLANYLRVHGKKSGNENTRKTSLIGVIGVLEDMKPKLETIAPLKDLIAKKYTGDLWQKGEDNKFKILKWRQDDLKRRFKKKLETASQLPKYHGNKELESVLKSLYNDKLTSIKDFRIAIKMNEIELQKL